MFLTNFQPCQIYYYPNICFRQNIIPSKFLVDDQLNKYSNPCPAKLILNFQLLQLVSRYRDPQPEVVENYSYLFNLRPKSANKTG